MSIRRSSPEYRLAFIKAINEGSFLIPTASAEEARNLRSYLYHYRAKLRRNKDPLRHSADQLKFLIHPYALEIQMPTAPGAEAIQHALEESNHD